MLRPNLSRLSAEPVGKENTTRMTSAEDIAKGGDCGSGGGNEES